MTPTIKASLVDKFDAVTVSCGMLLNLLKWVVSARSRDKDRIVLNRLLIAPEGRAVATDGRRLHYAKTSLLDASIPEGMYEVASITGNRMILLRVTDGSYPKWQAVVPTGDAVTNLCGAFKYDMPKALYLLAQAKACVDPKFLEQAMAFDVFWRIGHSVLDNSVKLVTDLDEKWCAGTTLTAVIMTVRVEG